MLNAAKEYTTKECLTSGGNPRIVKRKPKKLSFTEPHTGVGQHAALMGTWARLRSPRERSLMVQSEPKEGLYVAVRFR